MCFSSARSDIFSGSPRASGGAARAKVGRAASAGFTLVEVLMAVVIFAMVMMGVYTTLFKAYQLSAQSRLRDEARAVLRTYVDQFERLQTTTLVSNAAQKRWLFNPTSGASGQGLNWGELSDDDVATTPLGAISHLAVTLGGTTHPITAKLTRDVSYVDPSSGSDSISQNIRAAGYMLRGTFSIEFTVDRKTIRQSMVVLRVAP